MSRIGEALSFLSGTMGSRRRGKRVVVAISLLMMAAGGVMLAWPNLTDVYTSRKQTQLAEDFVSPEFKTKFSSGKIEDGQVLTRVQIPSIGVNALIVEGTDAKALRAGAGHYKKSALPCEAGNVAIAGHRTTYGKPFSRLDEVKPGAEITLITPEKQCKYTVTAAEGKQVPGSGSAAWVTTPDNGKVIEPTKDSILTLTTCHPKGSAKERLILRADLA